MADIRTWKKTTVAELIELYKSFPCLWKIKSEVYKNKYLKEEAYNELVDFCKEKGFLDVNRDFVVKKIQSLRGSFRKELKKLRNSQRNARGGDDVYIPSLWYFDNLMFTKDQELPRGMSNNDEDLEDETLTNDDETNGLSEEEHNIKCDVDPTVTATTSVQRNKRKATSNYGSEYLEGTYAGKELSEFDISGMNVAKKLSKMHPLQAIYAESIINNVLRKGLLTKLTEDTDLCDNHCDWRFPSRSRSTCDLPDTNMVRFTSVPSTQMYQSEESQDFKPIFYEGSNAMLREDPQTED